MSGKAFACNTNTALPTPFVALKRS